MRYKLLGASGLRVSELALGAMIFGGKVAPDESSRIFTAFAEAGGTFVDTADAYGAGASERIVGELLGSDRDRFVLATKYTLSRDRSDPNGAGNHRKSLVHALDASLRRLRTDYVDLLWIHIWDFLMPVEEVMRALDDQVRAGKVLYVGVSDTPAWIGRAREHDRRPPRLDPLHGRAGPLQPARAHGRARHPSDDPRARPGGDRVGAARSWPAGGPQ